MPYPIMDCLCPTVMRDVLGGSQALLSCSSQSYWVGGLQEKHSHLGQTHSKLTPSLWVSLSLESETEGFRSVQMSPLGSVPD